MVKAATDNGKNVTVMTKGLQKKKKTNTADARNEDHGDIRQVYSYEYVPPPPKRKLQTQSEKRQAEVILKNRAAGKTVRDASIYSDTIKGCPRTDHVDVKERKVSETETEEEGLVSLAQKALLGLGYYVGEGAVSVSKKVSDISK